MKDIQQEMHAYIDEMKRQNPKLEYQDMVTAFLLWKIEQLAAPRPAESDAVAFAEWVDENYIRVHSIELDKQAWINFKEEDVLRNGSDYHYTTLVNKCGKTTPELYKIFKNSNPRP